MTVHEMTIAANILQIAEAEAAAAGARAINRIEVEVGDLAGVEVPALQFCFGAARGGLAAGAELVIVPVPGRGRCMRCGESAPMEFFAAVCPACGRSCLEITQGRELAVRRLNVD